MQKKQRKRSSITLSLTNDEKRALESIAGELGCLWGNEPNISKLVRMIAEGALVVHKVSLPPEIKDQEAFIKHLATIQSATLNLLKATTGK